MLIVLTITIIIIPFLSPLKVAFSVTLVSVALRVALYSTTSSVFPASGVVISFSSGIIILFCYCAMIRNYERKNSGVIKWGFLALRVVLWRSWETRKGGYTRREVSRAMSSPILVFAIIVIITTMVCINKRIFTPTKSLMGSY